MILSAMLLFVGPMNKLANVRCAQKLLLRISLPRLNLPLARKIVLDVDGHPRTRRLFVKRPYLATELQANRRRKPPWKQPCACAVRTPSDGYGRIVNSSITKIGEGLPVIQTGSFTDRRVVHKDRCRQFLGLIHPR